MTQVIDFKTAEKNTLLSVLNEYPLMDSFNIANIIEDMIYEEVEEYHNDGSLMCKYTLRFGEKEGLYQRWWENGQKWIECTFIDGKKYGLYKEWWSDGEKMTECTYRNGKLIKK